MVKKTLNTAMIVGFYNNSLKWLLIKLSQDF